MSDEQTVEEIKARLKVEIPVEEEEILKVEVDGEKSDIVNELSNMGRKFAETMKNGWNSEERTKFEAEIRQGVRSFADEVDKVIRDLKSSSTTEKVRTEASNVRTKLEADEVAQKARGGFVKGLRWFSDELGKLADSFTPETDEKQPEDVAE